MDIKSSRPAQPAAKATDHVYTNYQVPFVLSAEMRGDIAAISVDTPEGTQAWSLSKKTQKKLAQVWACAAALGQ